VVAVAAAAAENAREAEEELHRAPASRVLTRAAQRKAAAFTAIVATRADTVIAAIDDARRASSE
tara:strand:- start:305 stop:496 length:192 start_codon:yes stop_codon:yes gene_type:complete